MTSSYRLSPHTLGDPGFVHVVTLLLLLLCTPRYVNNPYVLTKLVEVLFIMTPGILPREHHMMDMWLSHPMATAHLARSLMKMYIGEYRFGGVIDLLAIDSICDSYNIIFVTLTISYLPPHRL